MNDDILKMAVKIARVIDDNVERDKSLAWIAQIQAAVNRPEDALETIEHIRRVDIRADALRKALDNLQTRFCSNNESMLQINSWLEKLMDETMSIPEIDVRCPKLNAINLLILSRLEDKEKAQYLLKQNRSEFTRLNIGKKRCKFLFAAYQLFLQMGNEAEALATLECILDGISEYQPVVYQGLMIGLTAYEFWKIQGSAPALECIERFDNPTVKSYAYMQLAELLAVGGDFQDAQQIANYLSDEDQKNSCDHFINMGQSLIQNASTMKGAVICINKSLYFNITSNKNESGFSDHEPPRSFPRPVWFSLAVSIMPKDRNDADDSKSDCKEDEPSVDPDDVVSEQTNENKVQETDWDKYDWDEFDWDAAKQKNHSIEEKLWSDSDSDDEDWDESNDGDDDVWEESDDEEGESWEESDDEEGESWKESDDEENESWKESDDEENESWEESDDEENESWEESVDDENESWEESDDDEDAENESDDDEKKKRPNFLEKKQRDFLKKFANREIDKIIHKMLVNRYRQQIVPSVDDSYRDRYFCMTESLRGIVSFNRTLPPSLYQHFIRRLTIFFPVIKKDAREKMPSLVKEKIEDYIARQLEIGFDEAWQEVISQGDYPFAVECALNYFCFQNAEDLVFGYE